MHHTHTVLNLGTWTGLALLLSVGVAAYVFVTAERSFMRLVYVLLGYCAAIVVLYDASGIKMMDVPGDWPVPEPYSALGVGIVALACYLKLLRVESKGYPFLVILGLGCITFAVLALNQLTLVSTVVWYLAALALVTTVVWPAIVGLAHKNK